MAFVRDLPAFVRHFTTFVRHFYTFVSDFAAFGSDFYAFVRHFAAFGSDFYAFVRLFRLRIGVYGLREGLVGLRERFSLHRSVLNVLVRTGCSDNAGIERTDIACPEINTVSRFQRQISTWRPLPFV